MSFAGMGRLRAAEAGAIVIAVVAEVCSLGLLSTSGWFLANCALAGLAVAGTFSYLAPSGAVRSFALGRIAAGYVQRVVHHRLALERLTITQLALYDGLAGRAGLAGQDDLAGRAGPVLRDGELLDLALADAQLHSESTIRVTTPITVFGVVSLGAVAVIATVSPLAAGLLLIATTGAGAVTFAAARRAAADESADSAALLRGEIVAALDAWPEMAALGATQHLRARSRSLLARQQRHRDAIRRRQIRTGFGLATISAVTLAGIVGVVAFAGVAAPELVFIALLAAGVLDLAVALGETSASWSQLRRARDRVGDLIGDPPLPPPARADRGAAGPRIGIHDWHTAPVCGEGLDLEVPSGGTLSVVGRSGTGKTTLLHAIAADGAHRDPAISISGSPRIVVVGHDEPTFTGTVAANLRLADPALTDDQIRQVLGELRLTGITPGTRVGVGGRQLSGGEQRRLHIARGVLTGAELLIVDEPDASLDEATAGVVREFLRRRLPRATIVLATHSLPDDPTEQVILLDPPGPGRRG